MQMAVFVVQAFCKHGLGMYCAFATQLIHGEVNEVVVMLTASATVLGRATTQCLQTQMSSTNNGSQLLVKCDLSAVAVP